MYNYTEVKHFSNGGCLLEKTNHYEQKFIDLQKFYAVAFNGIRYCL